MEIFNNYIREFYPWEIRLNALNKQICNEINVQILQTLVITQMYI